MLKPGYYIKIGQEVFDRSRNQEIMNIKVDLDLEIPADRFEMGIKPGEKVKSIKIGDPVFISLGDDKTLTNVLSGRVGAIEPAISDVRISGYSAVYILTRIRINQVYENQTAGQIIKDLTGIAGIIPEKIDDGITLPMYVIDDSKDIYTHMRELAIRCGFDLFLTSEGKTVFRKYSRDIPKKVKFGRDIIEATCNEPALIANTVRVYGESPVSFKGFDKVKWLTKNVVEGKAGNGPVELTIEDPAVRDNDTAEKVAIAYLERISVPLTGTVKILGNASIKLGETLEMSDLSDTRMNGEFEVTSISHMFDKSEGFSSIIGWMKKIVISPNIAPLPETPAILAPIPSAYSPLEDSLRKAEVDSDRARLRLQDQVEEGELALDQSQIAINTALAKADKFGKELIEEGEKARDTAFEQAGILRQNDGPENQEKATALEKEAEEKLSSIRKKVDAEKVKLLKKIEELKKSYQKTRLTVLKAKRQLEGETESDEPEGGDDSGDTGESDKPEGGDDSGDTGESGKPEGGDDSGDTGESGKPEGGEKGEGGQHAYSVSENVRMPDSEGAAPESATDAPPAPTQKSEKETKTEKKSKKVKKTKK